MTHTKNNLVIIIIPNFQIQSCRAIGSGNNTPHFSSSCEFHKLHTDRLHCETQ